MAMLWNFNVIFMFLFVFFFRRCQTSREGNLDSADMESNSSKNSHGRDYWGNQQVSDEMCFCLLNTKLIVYRLF